MKRKKLYGLLALFTTFILIMNISINVHTSYPLSYFFVIEVFLCFMVLSYLFMNVLFHHYPLFKGYRKKVILFLGMMIISSSLSYMTIKATENLIEHHAVEQGTSTPTLPK